MASLAGRRDCHRQDSAAWWLGMYRELQSQFLSGTFQVFSVTVSTVRIAIDTPS